MSIIMLEKGKDAQKVEKSDFEKEGMLQEYIHNHPESIPVYEIQEDKRLFVAVREFPTESGPIDAVAFDKDGDVYIIETKLYKNPDKRNVVAQVLDYGAALWKHTSSSDFFDSVNEKCHNFEEKIKNFFEIDDLVMEDLLKNIEINLLDGNLKFVILMDVLDDALKDLIVYINQNSQFDIYAVQIEYYKNNNCEIIIPKLFGAETKKESPRVKKVNKDRQTFFNELISLLNNQILDKYKVNRCIIATSHCQIPAGKAGTHFEFQIQGRRLNEKSLAVGLHFESNIERNNKVYSKILKVKNELEEGVGEKVNFQESWGQNWKRIDISRKMDDENSEEIKRWAVEKMKIFIETLQPELDKI